MCTAASVCPGVLRRAVARLYVPCGSLQRKACQGGVSHGPRGQVRITGPRRVGRVCSCLLALARASCYPPPRAGEFQVLTHIMLMLLVLWRSGPARMEEERQSPPTHSHDNS